MVTWTYDITDRRLWAWIGVNSIMFIFIIMFFYIYILGKYQSEENRLKRMKVSNVSIGVSTNNDYKIFDRLRLLCCFILICYSIWPFQFYLSNLKQYERLLIVCCSSIADLGVTLMITIIAHRTLTSYHKIVKGIQLPSCYNFILITFFICNGICSFLIEILSYGFVNKLNIFDTIYNYWAYPYIAAESILFILLFRFLVKIAIIFSKIFKYEKSRGLRPTDQVNHLYIKIISEYSVIYKLR